jgi:hypothetical protein
MRSRYGTVRTDSLPLHVIPGEKYVVRLERPRSLLELKAKQAMQRGEDGGEGVCAGG